MTKNFKNLKAIFSPAVVVAALGYFVDIYDLLLFNIVRISSLRDIGLTGQELQMGAMLHNIQMSGMVIGGLLWGIMGDKKGRLSVLFGSIILYSAANLLNAFVQNFEQYAILRLIAGIGLAGELGAGITLVAETLPAHLRGYGTLMVATIGVSGAVVAGIVGEIFDWRICYAIGGILGFLLLLLRVGVFESGMFTALMKKETSRGNFLMFFHNPERFFRYLRCILIGIPIWCTIGILVAFGPEFGKAMGVVGEIKASRSIMFCYMGLIVGDFTSGYLSQVMESRKKAVGIFLGILAVSIAIYLNLGPVPAEVFYAMIFSMGLGTGYWAVLVTIAVEQFGTNLRATAGTSVPNFVRGSVVPMSLLFLALKPTYGIIHSAAITVTASMVFAAAGLFWMRETFGADLNYLEK
ncbi:MAG: MFS transporter [Bdellovibrionales bacterium]|nr:MFS transporter [Bdellovibrionales bacterium]